MTSFLWSPSRSPTASDRPRSFPCGSAKNASRPRLFASSSADWSRVSTLARPDCPSRTRISAPPLPSICPNAIARGHLQGEPLLGPELLLVGREPDVDGVVALGVDDHQVLGAVAVQVDGLDQPGIAGGVRHALGLAQAPGRGLIDEDQFLLRQQGQVVAAVLVEVAHGQCRRPLNGVAGIDLLGTAEPALSLVEEDLDLGRRAVEDEVGLAVSIEVAGIHADDFLVDRDAHEPHATVVLEIVGVLAERAGGLVVVGFLGAQQQVDPRPAVVADDDVVDLVAVQVLELEVADPAVELVELQRQEPEVIGELFVGGLGQGGWPQQKKCQECE